MRRRITVFLLVVSILVGGMCSAQAGALTRESMYHSMQQELYRYFNDGECRPLEMIVAEFEALEKYEKSYFFAYYVSILRDTEQKYYEKLPLYTRVLRLDEEFMKLLEELELPSVDEVEAYALGRQAEEAGDWPAAIAYYEKCIDVLDSILRMTELLLAGPTATPVPTATPTPAPLRLSADASDGLIHLFWESTAGSGATYQVQRRKGSNATWTVLETLSGQDAYDYDDYAIANKTRYYYRVVMQAGSYTQTSNTVNLLGVVPTPTPTPSPTPKPTTKAVRFQLQNGCTYQVTGTNTCMLIGVADTNWEIELVGEFRVSGQRVRVTAIGTGAFEGNDTCQRLVLPDTVISIEEGAFRGSEIRTIVIPDSVSFVDPGAFDGMKYGRGNLSSIKVQWKSREMTAQEFLKRFR